MKRKTELIQDSKRAIPNKNINMPNLDKQIEDLQDQLHLEKENCSKWKQVAKLLYDTMKLPYSFVSRYEYELKAELIYKKLLENLP